MLYPDELRALKQGNESACSARSLRTVTAPLIPQLRLLQFMKNGVTDGARTRDNQNHNLGLYQLSYGHHVG